jgi:hypothetical protein
MFVEMYWGEADEDGEHPLMACADHPFPADLSGLSPLVIRLPDQREIIVSPEGAGKIRVTVDSSDADGYDYDETF